MTQEQFRLDVQNAVKNYVQQFMRQNQIPAAMMEDAMNAALLEVKAMVFSELLLANQQEAEAAASADVPTEEETTDGK